MSAQRERVLVVDDDPDVLKFVSAVLSRNGYEVLTASSGEEALAIVHGSATPVHLLVSDVVMPVMSGPELADQIMEENGARNILFMSGYDEGHIARYGGFRRGFHTILKPFTPEGLLAFVETALEEAVAARHG